MDTRQLRLFIAIADRGSVTAAAEALDAAQPTLTKRLRELESELGASLFERRPRGMRLTAFGAAIEPHLRAALREIDNAGAEIVGMREGQRGRVRVSAGATWCSELLPRAVARLIARHAGVDVVVSARSRPDSMLALCRGEVDLALGPIDASDPPPPEIRQEKLTDDEMVVVGRLGHPLARRAPLELSHLLAADWALPDNSFARMRWSHLFQRIESELPRPRIETSSVELLLRLVAQTDVLTLLPTVRLRTPSAAGLMILPSVLPPLRRDAGLFLRRRGTPSPAARLLIREIREVAAEVAHMVQPTARDPVGRA